VINSLSSVQAPSPSWIYANLEDLTRALFALVKPPPLFTLSEWADAKRIISPESNPVEQGAWRTSRAEYQRGIMDMISSGIIPQTVRDLKGQVLQKADGTPLLVNPWKVVLMKSSRTGFTSILENATGYSIDYDPGNIMMVQPTVEDAREWSKDSLSALLRDTPCLQGKVREARMKDSGNTILHKSFPGGYIRVIGANSPRGFRRVTIRHLFFDELDGAPLSAGTEGDPLSLAERRTATVWNRKVVVGSSPTIAGISPIEYQYCNSNQMHFFVPCPHCRHYQVLLFSQKSLFARPSYRLADNKLMVGGLGTGFLKFDPDNCTWAHYVCESCSAEIEEASKSGMVAAGQWRAAVPDVTDVAGFHINELYSSFNTTWKDLARDFLVANQQVQTLRVFMNTRVGEVFEEADALTISDDILLRRVEPYENVPEGAYLLTAGVDVQGDRIEVVVWAWGDGDESWLIEHAVLAGSPHERFAWDNLDQYLKKEFSHARGTIERPVNLSIRCAFVDSSAYTTDVYRFTAPRESRGIFSVKGHQGPRPLFKPSGRDRRTHAALFILGVDDAKQKIYDRLAKHLPEEHRAGMPVPGYMHLNKHATLNFLQQLTSEKRVRKVTKKGVSLIWELPAGRRNEALDMAVYALCAMELMRPVWPTVKRNFEKRLASIAAGSPSTPELEAEERQRIVRRRRSGWGRKI
jgi:phage terminase large subunit GpA-like protein